jgi:hypothetical protein
MHTTVDESTGVRDARFTEHTRRSAFLAAVHRAIEIDGLPAPRSIDFRLSGTSVALDMDNNAAADVDDWAANFNATASYGHDGEILTGSHRPFRSYETRFTLTNYRVEVRTFEDADTEVLP